MNPEYLKLYDGIEYFLSNYGGYEQRCWDFNQLRYGDQIPSICYAFGFESFEEVRNLYRFEEEGKSGYPIIGALEQLFKFTEKGFIRRYPKSVLDIGGGRGEVAVAMSYLSGYFRENMKVNLIEPSKSALYLLKRTREKFGIYNEVTLWNYELKIAQQLIDWTDIDTVIMTESIEHIEQEDFDNCYENFIKPTLKKNSGLFIITNWYSFHPIELLLPYHCRRVDDTLYDLFCSDGTMVFRKGSHLVVKYGG